MAAWIALIVSTTSLLVSIIAQRDKLAGAIKDFHIWRSDHEQRIKAEEIVAKLNSTGTQAKKETTKNSPSLGTVFSVFFLPLAICSGASSILETNSPLGLSTLGAIPFVVSMTTLATREIAEELKSKTMKWYYWFIAIAGVLGSAFVGVVWCGMTVVAMSIGLPLLWAGMLSAAVFSILTWLSQYGKKRRRTT